MIDILIAPIYLPGGKACIIPVAGPEHLLFLPAFMIIELAVAAPGHLRTGMIVHEGFLLRTFPQARVAVDLSAHSDLRLYDAAKEGGDEIIC